MSADFAGADAPDHAERDLPALTRLRIYLGERFPPIAHGTLIAAFAGSAVCVAALARGAGATPSWGAFTVAFATLFLLFFQLRVADEHKDFADDSRYRPERAVPRGLISLAALRRLALGAAGVQAGLALAWHPSLAWLLLGCWAWMALMTVEFFAPAWLKARPALYLLSHMVAMPLFALLALAAEALPAGLQATRLAPLGAFAALSFAGGVAIEVARKCYAPEAERPGVETYSRLWGARAAGTVVALVTLAGVALALLVAGLLDLGAAYPLAIAAMGLAAMVIALRYATRPRPATSRAVEIAAGLFVLVSYVALGPLPLAVTSWMP